MSANQRADIFATSSSPTIFLSGKITAPPQTFIQQIPHTSILIEIALLQQFIPLRLTRSDTCCNAPRNSPLLSRLFNDRVTIGFLHFPTMDPVPRVMASNNILLDPIHPLVYPPPLPRPRTLRTRR